MKNKIDITLDKIKSAIKNTKFNNNTHLAGGCVRDEIMNKKPKDYDFCISLPNGGIDFANYITSYYNERPPVIFERFGTAHFILDGFEFEATMTRAETYNESNRNPEVKYTTLKNDVFRRDLNINSLLKNISTGEILDLTGKGIHDIKNKIIRTPLEPNITFSDDPLRMLRCIRFCVKYNFKLPYYMIKSIKNYSYRLKIISTERINDELNKILKSNNPYVGIRLLKITNILHYIIPEIDNDNIKNIYELIKKSKNDLHLRLAILLYDLSPKTSNYILVDLKYSNDDIKKIITPLTNYKRIDTIELNYKECRRLKYELKDNLETTLELMKLKNCGKTNKIIKILNELKNEPKTITLPINGNDIMKTFNLKPNKQVGKLMNISKELWFENPNITKNEILNRLKIQTNLHF